MRAWSITQAACLRASVGLSALLVIIRRVAIAARAGYHDQFDLWLALGPRYLHTPRHDTEHPNRFGDAFTAAAAVAAFLEGAYLDRHGQMRPPRDPPTCSVVLCGS